MLKKYKTGYLCVFFLFYNYNKKKITLSRIMSCCGIELKPSTERRMICYKKKRPSNNRRIGAQNTYRDCAD